MKTNNNNGMSNKVAAANIVKHFDNFTVSNGVISLNYFGHEKDNLTPIDGADVIESAQGLMGIMQGLYGNLNSGEIICGDKTYDFSVTTRTPIWDENENFIGLGVRIRIYNGDNVIKEYTTTASSKWGKTICAWVAESLYDFMTELVEKEEEIKEQQMQECVANYQTEFDGYVEDLKSIAPNYDSLETSIDRFAAKSILEKMQTLSEDLLTALGEITRCDMVEEDGYWLDTTDLCRWYGRTDDFYVDDYDDLISTLDYKVAEMSAPLGLDEEDLEYINEGGCYCFDGYPMYLWQDMRDFISTYYHYAYCA